MNTKVFSLEASRAKRILSFCPYYDDIINYDIRYDDEFSFDLIDWYKDLVFSCDMDMEVIKVIDKCMYLYINSYEYRKGLMRIVNIGDIDMNSDKRKRRLIKKIINYTDRYEEDIILNIRVNKWI